MQKYFGARRPFRVKKKWSERERERDTHTHTDNNNYYLFILRKFNINFQMRVTMYMRTSNLKTAN